MTPELVESWTKLVVELIALLGAALAIIREIRRVQANQDQHAAESAHRHSRTQKIVQDHETSSGVRMVGLLRQIRAGDQAGNGQKDGGNGTDTGS